MNVFTNRKKQKKIIIVLVLLILFNFCCPKRVEAGIMADIVNAIIIAPAKILYFIEKGVLILANDMFCNEKNKSSSSKLANGIETLKISLTVENIIKGKFLLFDANLFKDVEESENDYLDYDTSANGATTAKQTLRKSIAGWYRGLVGFSLVAMMCVLVYVGIRMVLSSLAKDKAKYKIMFKDWLVAMCLLIFMHFIMIAILNVTSMITSSIGGSGKNSDIIGTVTGNISTAINADPPDFGQAYANVLVLLALIFYLIVFIVKYLKREFTIMFLILLGPLSCITYPIDKISDGKAQAFNKWFTEFLYQVLIQPFHLILYIVLISTAVDFANKNFIYTIICMGVLIPAEKFVKEMFGFRDKLGSPLGDLMKMDLARNAMKALTTKEGKGSHIEKEGGENDAPPKLQDKTTNKNDLVDGEGSGGPDGAPALGAGAGSDRTEEPEGEHALGEGAKPGGETDKVENANESHALDDGENTETNDDDDDEDYNEFMQARLESGSIPNNESKINESNDGSETETDDDKSNKPETATDDAESNKPETANDNSKPKKPDSWIASQLKRASKTHARRMALKYGTTSRGKRWAIRGWRALKGTTRFVAKKGIRLASTLAGAALIGTLGAMTGQGAKGFAAGAILGSKAGSGIIKGVSNTKNKVYKAAKEYHNDMLDDKGKEKAAFNDFVSDKKQINNAINSYRKNHDGEDPNSEQLESELEDRYELSRYGMKDDQIDDCLALYQQNKEELMPDEEQGKQELADMKENGASKEEIKAKEAQMEAKKEEAKRIAAARAKNTAKLANRYSAKDFTDPEVMKNAYNKVFDGLKNETGCSDEMADKFARKYLTDAAKVNKVSEFEVALPKTIEMQMLKNSGVSNPTKEQIKKAEKMHVKLKDAGLNNNQILKLCACVDKDPKKNPIEELEYVIDTYIEYEGNEKVKTEVEAFLGTGASKQETQDEVIERFTIGQTFEIRDQKAISNIRVDEMKLGNEKEVQQARQLGQKIQKNDGKMSRKDEAVNNQETKNLAQKYGKQSQKQMKSNRKNK